MPANGVRISIARHRGELLLLAEAHLDPVQQFVDGGGQLVELVLLCGKWQAFADARAVHS
ncbi:MAG: hypothetical protein IPO17_01060 [Flavobacteriales bacterium]|nr:hypothetical protein [Flavobacteriales bacterium]